MYEYIYEYMDMYEYMYEYIYEYMDMYEYISMTGVMYKYSPCRLDAKPFPSLHLINDDDDDDNDFAASLLLLHFILCKCLVIS